MKIKQISIISIAVFAMLGLSTLSTSPVDAAECGDVQTSIIDCPQTGDVSGDNYENTGIWALVLLVINILATGVGVAAVVGIVYGAILYSSAGGSPEKVKKARTVIMNVVIGLLLFAAMYSLLNFLIPGGVFS